MSVDASRIENLTNLLSDTVSTDNVCKDIPSICLRQNTWEFAWPMWKYTLQTSAANVRMLNSDANIHSTVQLIAA
jgi:hypothetical protein